jgi:hypothetical protein
VIGTDVGPPFGVGGPLPEAARRRRSHRILNNESSISAVTVDSRRISSVCSVRRCLRVRSQIWKESQCLLSHAIIASPSEIEIQMSADAETLNVVQQVLRGVVVSLAMHRQDDMARLGSALEAFAIHQRLEPMAKQMLLDLAMGCNVLGRAKTNPS